jgi:hypothetical protein
VALLAPMSRMELQNALLERRLQAMEQAHSIKQSQLSEKQYEFDAKQQRGAQGFKEVDPDYVRAIGEYREPMPTANSRAPGAQEAREAVLQKYPDYDHKHYDELKSGMVSGARTTGVREANMNMILNAVDAAIPAALDASKAFKRGTFVPLNKIIQAGKIATSDPKLKVFGVANLQLADHWAKAMNPTGVMRVDDRDKALEYLSTLDSQETYEATVRQLEKQITRERDSIVQGKSQGLSKMGGEDSEDFVPKNWTYKKEKLPGEK